MSRPSRRAVLRGAAGTVAAGAAAVGTSRVASAQPTFDGWMSDVDNYEAVFDRTGQSEVRVGVGTEGNGGAYAFGPPAIQVDPGTTVVWEWTGNGGQHNVVSESGASFESELVAEAGFTFEYTFEEAGVTKYYCLPHRSLGMKGVVVVGDNVPTPPSTEAGGEGGGPTLPGGPMGAALAAIGYGSLGLVALTLAGAEAYAEIGRRGGIRGPEPDPTAAEEPVAEAPAFEPVEAVEHDSYDPTGTAALIAGYFVILVLMWVFMYFVEFLGNNISVVG
jgi:halocyanin-like protein